MSGRCAWPGRFPRCIDPEAQTVDKMLGVVGVNQQLCGDLDHGALARTDVLAAIKRCQRQTSNELASPCELSNSPCLYLTAESRSAVYFQPGRVEYPYHPANTAGAN